MIYVITAVHNRFHITEEFVKQLNRQKDLEHIKLVLVDDGSTDGTSKMVKGLFPNNKVIIGDGSLFWGGAMHAAYKYLSEIVQEDDMVFYSNDDVTFSDDYIQLAANILDKRPNDVLTGCCYDISNGDYIDGPVLYDFEQGKELLLKPSEEGNCASTRSLFMTGKTYKDIGGFHPLLLPHYGSDYEYTIRAYKKGHIIFSDSALKYHTGTASNSSSNRRLFHKGSTRNLFQRISFYLLIIPKCKLLILIKNKIINAKNKR